MEWLKRILESGEWNEERGKENQSQRPMINDDHALSKIIPSTLALSQRICQDDEEKNDENLIFQPNAHFLLSHFLCKLPTCQEAVNSMTFISFIYDSR